MTTTTVSPSPTRTESDARSSTVVTPSHFALSLGGDGRTWSLRRRWVAVPLWLAAITFGVALVLYGFGPVFHARDQRQLQGAMRAAIGRAANEATGLSGVTVSKHAPKIGAPVAMLEIGRVRLQQAIVEGVSTSQTRAAPGHVPGSSGLGQKGNAVVVGRAAAFGGSFRSINRLHKGDAIVVSTTQGQSRYDVVSVKAMSLRTATVASTARNQLTLITSSSDLPFNSRHAIVVVAKMNGTAFKSTPQAKRSAGLPGTGGDRHAFIPISLALLGYALTIVASVVLYRRLRSRTAYLLTVAPVVAVTIILTEALSRAFPAWM